MARAVETYAPESFYKNTEEFISPTHGGGVEVIVAWRERVVGSYHFHRQGEVSVGTHPSCDITLPILDSFVDKLVLFNIAYGVQLCVPAQFKVQREKISSNREGSARVGTEELSTYVEQDELVTVFLSESVKLLIRRSVKPISPRVIPFVDLSSDGFLSLAFAVVLALALGLMVKLYPTPKSSAVTEPFYATPLILQSPKRVAKILNLPSPKKLLQNKGPSKPTPAKVSQQQKASQEQKLRQAGATPKATRPKPVKTGSTEKPTQQKVSKNQGAQAKSEHLKKSNLFAVMSNFGGRQNLDKGYDGEGELAGLAAQATGRAGDSQDHRGVNGPRLRQTGTRTGGDGNVGVETLGKGTGGIGNSMGRASLGKKASIAIVPGGEGALISGTIDREGIRQVFFDNSRAIRSCYERQLNKNTSLSGKVMVSFDIGQGGRVIGAPRVNRPGSTLINSSMSACLLARLKTWRFPDPPTGQIVNVLYPLAFSSRP